MFFKTQKTRSTARNAVGITMFCIAVVFLPACGGGGGGGGGGGAPVTNPPATQDVIQNLTAAQSTIETQGSTTVTFGFNSSTGNTNGLTDALTQVNASGPQVTIVRNSFGNFSVSAPATLTTLAIELQATVSDASGVVDNASMTLTVQGKNPQIINLQSNAPNNTVNANGSFDITFDFISSNGQFNGTDELVQTSGTAAQVSRNGPRNFTLTAPNSPLDETITFTARLKNGNTVEHELNISVDVIGYNREPTISNIAIVPVASQGGVYSGGVFQITADVQDLDAGQNVTVTLNDVSGGAAIQQTSFVINSPTTAQSVAFVAILPLDNANANNNGLVHNFSINANDTFESSDVAAPVNAEGFGITGVFTDYTENGVHVAVVQTAEQKARISIPAIRSRFAQFSDVKVRLTVGLTTKAATVVRINNDGRTDFDTLDVILPVFDTAGNGVLTITVEEPTVVAKAEFAFTYVDPSDTVVTVSDMTQNGVLNKFSINATTGVPSAQTNLTANNGHTTKDVIPGVAQGDAWELQTLFGNDPRGAVAYVTAAGQVTQVEITPLTAGRNVILDSFTALKGRDKVAVFGREFDGQTVGNGQCFVAVVDKASLVAGAVIKTPLGATLPSAGIRLGVQVESMQFLANNGQQSVPGAHVQYAVIVQNNPTNKVVFVPIEAAPTGPQAPPVPTIQEVVLGSSDVDPDAFDLFCDPTNGFGQVRVNVSGLDTVSNTMKVQSILANPNSMTPFKSANLSIHGSTRAGLMISTRYDSVSGYMQMITVESQGSAIYVSEVDTSIGFGFVGQPQSVSFGADRSITKATSCKGFGWIAVGFNTSAGNAGFRIIDVDQSTIFDQEFSGHVTDAITANANNVVYVTNDRIQSNQTFQAHVFNSRAQSLSSTTLHSGIGGGTGVLSASAIK